MDDSLDYTVPGGSGGRSIPRIRAEPWSCVDYVDFPAEETGSTAQRVSSLASDSTLSRRFANLRGANTLREDTPGTCRKLWTINGRAIFPAPDCASVTVKSRPLLEGSGHRGTQTDGKLGARVWYANKQTNRGWPGTAKGKINT
ncbi:hypothetical protein, partial [Anaplasma platys]|uniref:hypothetical protein n=1 Tax=Anaplasma platys TaxID=949 RepID=UPI00145EFD90